MTRRVYRFVANNNNHELCRIAATPTTIQVATLHCSIPEKALKGNS